MPCDSNPCMESLCHRARPCEEAAYALWEGHIGMRGGGRASLGVVICEQRVGLECSDVSAGNAGRRLPRVRSPCVTGHVCRSRAMLAFVVRI